MTVRVLLPWVLLKQGLGVPLPMEALSNWDLGNLELRVDIFVMFCEPSLSSSWCVQTHCPAGGGTAFVECCDHEGMYWVGDLCQLDPKFPNSTLNCHIVISVIHCTCSLKSFKCCGHISSGVRTPQDPPGGAGGRFFRERRLDDLVQTSAITIQHWMKMDGWWIS